MKMKYMMREMRLWVSVEEHEKKGLEGEILWICCYEMKSNSHLNINLKHDIAMSWKKSFAHSKPKMFACGILLMLSAFILLILLHRFSRSFCVEGSLTSFVFLSLLNISFFFCILLTPIFFIIFISPSHRHQA